MTLLTPLGLLGLLGIVALIIIYIIRPNYQQKFVSTTFVWKLSLKYRKRKIPISKLRNILIIICQILILTGCAFILAQPSQILKAQVEEAEIIAIIDSSASMRSTIKVGTKKQTRFERAVQGVIDLANDTIDNNGIVSVIFADNEPMYMNPQRATADNKDTLISELNALLPKKQKQDVPCGYGEADILGAIELCEEVFQANPEAQIYLFTDSDYAYVPEGIVVRNVSEPGEWNGAILDAYSQKINGFYGFVVELGCYGYATEIGLSVEVQGVGALNKDDDNNAVVTLTTYVDMGFDETQTVLFVNEDVYANDPYLYTSSYDVVEPISEEDWIATYKSVHIEIDVDDNFYEDDSFDLYDGLKEVIKIQYQSGSGLYGRPNPFVPGALEAIKATYADRWDIKIDEVKEGEEGAIEGFDYYIFEHDMPSEMPKDGVVFLFDPDKAPKNAGFTVNGDVGDAKQELPLWETAEGESHPLLNKVYFEENVVTSYVKTSNYDAGYTTLITCDNNPILSVKNEPDAKVVVLAFNIHFSSLPENPDLALLMANIFNYFFPTTVQGSSFEVNERVSLNSRGETLEVSSSTFTKTFNTFPTVLSVDAPGQYTLKQIMFEGTLAEKEIIERIYVKVPSSESNINKIGEGLTNPYQQVELEEFYRDLMFYIAAAMTLLLFVEWWLSSRNTM